MKHVTKLFFILVLVGSIYHLLRDLLQIVGLNSLFTDFLHRPHAWCAPYCDYVTLPLDLILIIGAAIVLRRNTTGYIGGMVILAIFLSILAFLLP